MKRSDFLAFIPALSAIPLIGKHIVKRSDRIEIYQPDEVKNYTLPKADEVTVAVIKNNMIVATGYLTLVSIDAPLIDTTCADHNGARSTSQPFVDVKIEASILGPVTSEMMEALHSSFRTRWNAK